jgi:hypothetical protein
LHPKLESDDRQTARPTNQGSPHEASKLAREGITLVPRSLGELHDPSGLVPKVDSLAVERLAQFSHLFQNSVLRAPHYSIAAGRLREVLEKIWTTIEVMKIQRHRLTNLRARRRRLTPSLGGKG